MLLSQKYKTLLLVWLLYENFIKYQYKAHFLLIFFLNDTKLILTLNIKKYLTFWDNMLLYTCQKENIDIWDIDIIDVCIIIYTLYKKDDLVYKIIWYQKVKSMMLLHITMNEVIYEYQYVWELIW